MKLIKEGFTNTGFCRVSRIKDNKYHNGFYYKYRRKNKNDEVEILTSVSIIDLKNKVQSKGWYWGITDKDLSNKTIIESEEIVFYKLPKNNTTGYYHVTIQKSNTTKQGFLYKYQYKTDKGYRAITSRTLEELQKKVEDKGMLWLSF